MDYPYQYEPDEVTATDSVPISKSDKKKLFQTNAERVFGLYALYAFEVNR
jgi:2,3-dihydroxybenzoate decarboxylase